MSEEHIKINHPLAYVFTHAEPLTMLAIFDESTVQLALQLLAAREPAKQIKRYWAGLPKVVEPSLEELCLADFDAIDIRRMKEIYRPVAILVGLKRKEWSEFLEEFSHVASEGQYRIDHVSVLRKPDLGQLT